MKSSNLILKELIYRVLDLILRTYEDLFEKLKNNKDESKPLITQNQSLQIVFDLKFLFTFFEAKASTSDDEDTNKLAVKINEAYKTVTSRYESLVDPFDYDISMPFIQSNVVKCIARSSVCFF